VDTIFFHFNNNYVLLHALLPTFAHLALAKGSYKLFCASRMELSKFVFQHVVAEKKLV
jgi:hypothetical protein